jgi:hypothetical protein
MAHPRKSREHDSTNGAVPGGRSDNDASDNPIDPRAFGLAKAAYGVGETLDLLSIGRTSLYAAVKRGDLKRVKFGKKTLFYAADLASFLTKLGRLSEADAHAPGCVYRKPRFGSNGDEVHQGSGVNERFRSDESDEKSAHPCAKTDAF